jgi:acyl-lipid omega-6 desaturase (Delta-12 desaturase)
MVDTISAPRQGRELIGATRPFASEVMWLSWYHTLTTFCIWLAALFAAAMAPFWWLRLILSVAAGFITVRGFILYHDYLHGAILRNSKLAKALFYTFGVYVLTAPRVWRQTHNYHHAHTAKLVGSHVGSYMMVTTQMWTEMGLKQRLMYRIIRHPMTIALGYLTLFVFGMCLSPFIRNPKRHWDSMVVLFLHLLVSALIWFGFGFSFYFFGFLLPIWVGCAVGGYLFYAQHNFPDLEVQPREDWSYTYAALHSSSYMKTGPVLAWLTGNIGYHHVHHLNPSVPFYRLPEAMASIPELQDPPITRLTATDIWRCFQLKLWDPQESKMVGYP